MKTRFVMMMAMVSIALGGIFASCEKDGTSYSKEQVVGKWDVQKIETDGEMMEVSGLGEICWIFRSDSTFTMRSHKNGAPEDEVSELSGTWRVSGSSIILTKDGVTEPITIIELTQQTMVLKIAAKTLYEDGHIEEEISYVYMTRDETYEE
jgi:hypothetical protein